MTDGDKSFNCVNASGVNFTNILPAAFTNADPKSAKDSQLKQLFGLLGSVCVKAACKHVNEIDPGSAFVY